MPCQYRILADLDLVQIRHSGDVTAAEQRKALASLTSDPGYHPSMLQLIDASRVSSSDVKLPSLLARREIHTKDLFPIDQPTRWSYFAPGELAFGLCRRAQILFEDIPNLDIGVFETWQDALDFLEIAPDALPAWSDCQDTEC